MVSSKVKAIDPPGAAKTYFAPGTVTNSNGTIQIPDQVGTTTDGTCPDSYESQIHLALLNLRKALVTANATITDLTTLTLHIVNHDPHHPIHTRHLQNLLGPHRPATTLVPVPHLAHPSHLFSISAVANAPTPIPPPHPASTPQQTTDVLIIGAGLSGLTAAHAILAAGHSCVVLEARDRVGGKTFSAPFASGSEGGTIDLGAAWINDSNQSRIITLARKFGAELIEQNTTGDVVFQDADGGCAPFAYGDVPPFDAATRQNVAHIRDAVEAATQAPLDPALDALTFAAYLARLGAGPAALATAAVWTRAMLGHEPGDVSAMYFLTYCAAGGGLLQMRSDRRGGGQYLRVRQGTQLFAKGLAEGVDVRLDCPVSDVVQLPRGEGVRVHTRAGGVVAARKVIVTLPSPALRTLAFHPPLPARKRLGVEVAGYGFYTKVMLRFRHAFWTARGRCGLAQSFVGPAAVVRDTSDPERGKWVLTCFLAGDPGRAWAELAEGGRTEALVRQVGVLFADEETARGAFVEASGYDWMGDEWAGWGCPCTAMGPGGLGAVGGVEARGERVGDVHFVGTETAGVWMGYMEGAVRSGERGAGEVVEALGGGKARL